jgi:NAD(P)-dependent dehydrogenase (short-subunit alcohol dehydrogenase family)
VLGPFLVTRELLPLLARTGDLRSSARIVNVASEMAHSLDLSDVELTRRGYDGMTAYAQSKQADRTLTWGLTRRIASMSVTANAMHPGWVATEITSRERGVKQAIVCAASKMFARKPCEGADTASWLAASPEVETQTGKFFVDRRARACRFHDEPLEEALWALCESMMRGETPNGTRPRSGQSISSTTLPKPSLLAT